VNVAPSLHRRRLPTHAIRAAQGGSEQLVDRDFEADDREAEGAVDGAGDDRRRQAVLRTLPGGEAPCGELKHGRDHRELGPVSRE
jgi:hypothetical protein